MRRSPTFALLSSMLIIVLLSCTRSAPSSTTPFDHPPSWAASAVWYQIFPERFSNGDPNNDPRPVDLTGAWPHEVAPGWQVSSWAGDWYAFQPWEGNDGKGFYFHVQQRRYGGDLQGVIDRLDYLTDLGINAIYLNPIFESPSLHKYDATFYHHVDNNFGPDPEGDRALWRSEDPSDPSTWKWSAADKVFLRLIQEAHKRGIRVVIDGVFNHVGMTFWAFEDVKKEQEKSRFKDWFSIKRWDDPKTPENEFGYEGWNGVRELPEIREDERGIVSGPREHIKAIVKRWMDPNGDGNPEDGIDGWRLDVAEKINPAFWREFRTWVREINPDAYIVGEVWWEDWQNEKMFNAAPWLQGDVFDAVMNYRWAREAFRFFAGQKTAIKPSDVVSRLDGFLKDYPERFNFSLMNLYDSHDTDRMSSHIVNADLPYDKRVGVSDNNDYNVRKPNEREMETLRLMAVFQMTYLGAPMIYYGTEAGMWGADDPDCRKPMVWPEMRFEPERSHPWSKFRPPDRNAFDSTLHAFYKELLALRRSTPALTNGSMKFILMDDAKNSLGFFRRTERSLVCVFLNNSSDQQQYMVGPEVIEWKNGWEKVFGDGQVEEEAGFLRISLPAKKAIVLRKT
ncbi:MAG TPA: glycoside hydrolase family 13 protein [Bacteroidota bacterium]|nr:glycoside hydrolase family 13 protein [Bacteroidota bacterium]